MIQTIHNHSKLLKSDGSKRSGFWQTLAYPTGVFIGSPLPEEKRGGEVRNGVYLVACAVPGKHQAVVEGHGENPGLDMCSSLGNCNLVVDVQNASAF